MPFPAACEAEQQRTVQSNFGPFEIGTRFAEEQAAAAPLPKHRFDPCVIRPAAAVDKYQTVAFDRNRYSVPRPFAFQMVTVKGYVDRVVIVAGGQVVATHARSLERAQRSSIRSTTSRRWAASPAHSTMRRCTATGSFLPASPSSAPTWNNTTVRRPAPAVYAGLATAGAIIRWNACVRRWRIAAVCR